MLSFILSERVISSRKLNRSISSFDKRFLTNQVEHLGQALKNPLNTIGTSNNKNQPLNNEKNGITIITSNNNLRFSCDDFTLGF